jgi:hypothetical protein
MVLLRELLLHRVCYLLSDGFFVEKMDLSLCRMDVDIDRPRINLEAEWMSERWTKGGYVKVTSGIQRVTTLSVEFRCKLTRTLSSYDLIPRVDLEDGLRTSF